MTQQIEVERTKIRTPVRDARRAGTSEREHTPHSAKRVITTFIVALAFAFAVIVGLIYMINSAAYQSTDDAFVDGHIVPVSAQVAGRVQSVYVDDNQSISKALLVLELDPRDFDAVVRQKTAALASSQAQAGATQAALQEAIAHIKTEQATVESDQATAAAALTPQVGSSAAHHQSYGLIYQTLQQQASLWYYVDLFRMLVIVCLACVPLVFLFKKPKGAVPPGELAAAH